jgi:hypothetical protein
MEPDCDVVRLQFTGKLPGAAPQEVGRAGVDAGWYPVDALDVDVSLPPDEKAARKAQWAERAQTKAKEAEAKAAEGEERVWQQAAERAKQREDDLREAAEAETEAERLRQRVAIDGAVLS